MVKLVLQPLHSKAAWNVLQLSNTIYHDVVLVHPWRNLCKSFSHGKSSKQQTFWCFWSFFSLPPNCASVSRFPWASRGRCYFCPRLVRSASKSQGSEITNPNLDPLLLRQERVHLWSGSDGTCRLLQQTFNLQKNKNNTQDLNSHHTRRCPTSVKSSATETMLLLPVCIQPKNVWIHITMLKEDVDYSHSIWPFTHTHWIYSLERSLITTTAINLFSNYTICT